jgi:hypothetical protein
VNLTSDFFGESTGEGALCWNWSLSPDLWGRK